jgi:FtsH-binding integral membrane protein
MKTNDLVLKPLVFVPKSEGLPSALFATGVLIGCLALISMSTENRASKARSLKVVGVQNDPRNDSQHG